MNVCAFVLFFEVFSSFVFWYRKHSRRKHHWCEWRLIVSNLAEYFIPFDWGLTPRAARLRNDFKNSIKCSGKNNNPVFIFVRFLLSAKTAVYRFHEAANIFFRRQRSVTFDKSVKAIFNRENWTKASTVFSSYFVDNTCYCFINVTRVIIRV